MHKLVSFSAFIILATLSLNVPKANAFILIGNTDDTGTTHNIVGFDEQTGTFLDDFIANGVGGLDIPDDLTFGPDGNLYVSSGNYNNSADSAILRYDGKTGAPLGVFASGGGLFRPYGTAFGSGSGGGKYLYVSSFISDQILRYDGTTGQFVDVFASGGTGKSGDVNGPNSLLFGPDGSLYVTTEGTVANTFPNPTISQVLRFTPDQVGSSGRQTPTVFVDQPTEQPVCLNQHWG